MNKKMTKKVMTIWVVVLLSISAVLFIIAAIFNLPNLLGLPLFALIGAICVFVSYMAQKENKREKQKQLEIEKARKNKLAIAQKNIESITKTVSALEEDGRVLNYIERFGSLNSGEFSRLCLTAFIYLGIGKRVGIKEDTYFTYAGNREFVVKCLPTLRKVTVKDIENFVKDENVSYKYNDGRKYIICSQAEVSDNAEKIAKNKRIAVLSGEGFAFCIRIAISNYNKYVDDYAKEKTAALNRIRKEHVLQSNKTETVKDFDPLDYTEGEDWILKLDILDDLLGD